MRRIRLLAGLALTAMALGGTAAAPAMQTINQTGQEKYQAVTGTAYSRKQFNFKRSGSDIKPGSAKARLIALKYGGIKKHFNKKRHGRNLRRKHARA